MVQFEGQSAELVDTREKNQQRLDENRAVALKMDILEKYADVFFSRLFRLLLTTCRLCGAHYPLSNGPSAAA